MSDTLKRIDPDVQILHFENIKDFFEAYQESLKSKKTEGKEKKTKGEEEDINFDFSQVKLILADIDATHNIDQSLWKKFLDFLNKHQQEEGAGAHFLYTSYSKDAEFNPRKYHSNTVFNILIKPLDPIIVHQTLVLALSGDGPLNVGEIYKQDQPALIELIKDIEIERLTELGFRTKSMRPIEINKVARYFGEPFAANGFDSLFAYCYNNQEVSKNPPQFSSSFSYLGISKDQLASIRRTIQASDKKEDYLFEQDPSCSTVDESNILLFTKDKDFASHLDSFFSDKFKNVNLRQLSSTAQLLDLLPPDQRANLIEEEKEVHIFNTKEDVTIKLDDSFSTILGFLPN